MVSGYGSTPSLLVDCAFDEPDPIKSRTWVVQREIDWENICKASLFGKMEWVLFLLCTLGSSFIWVFLWILVAYFYVFTGVGTFIRMVFAEPAWLLGHII